MRILKCLFVLACGASVLALPRWCAAQTVRIGIRGDHPRLLLTQDDLRAMRVRAGIPGYENDPLVQQDHMLYGTDRRALTGLESAAEQIMQAAPQGADLLAPAMLHLLTGHVGEADARSRYVTGALLERKCELFRADALLALDACWDTLEPDERLALADQLADKLQPLKLSDNPFSPLDMEKPVPSLLAALLLQDPQLAIDRPATASTVREVIHAADLYMNTALVPLVQQRGVFPTAGGDGAQEQARLMVMVESWANATGQALWPQLAASLGRCMEYWFYADTDDSALEYGFVHDNGAARLRAPLQTYEGFVPIIPFVASARVSDPFASWYADRSPLLASPEKNSRLNRYQWIPLRYGRPERPGITPTSLPLGRSFGGGWVAMRSGFEGGDTVVLFDAGQPYWRVAQHFDAGQFQIYRKGRLAIDSGDDVTLQAVEIRGGRTTIGGKRGDWDQYYLATIAHNAITVFDADHVGERYHRPWLAVGNQRVLESNYDPGGPPLVMSDHRTGSLEAFETNSYYTTALADLSHAYPAETVRRLQRRVLFIHAGCVIVLDRVEAIGSKTIKTWHLQLPRRPQWISDGRPQALEEARQLHGVDPESGVFQADAGQQWLDVTNGEGRLFVRTFLPAESQRRVCGGPMEPRQISEGRYRGTTYFGGGEFGYEHRLWPASFLQAPNAAYQLGRPTRLDASFGVGSTWGRLDVSPADNRRNVVFLHVLQPVDKSTTTPIPVDFRCEDQAADLAMTLGGRQVRITLDTLDIGDGQVRITDAGGDVLIDRRFAVGIAGADDEIRSPR